MGRFLKQWRGSMAATVHLDDTILASIPALVAVYSIATGHYVYVNEALERVLGYTAEEFLSGGIAFVVSLVHPDDVADLLAENAAALERVHQQGFTDQGSAPILTFEYRMKHRDGTYHWLHTTGTVFERSEQGLVTHVLNISVDITKRKEQELAAETAYRESEARKTASLQQSEKRFRTLLERSFDAIVLTTPAGKSLYASPSIKQVIGYSPEEYLNLNSVDLVYPEDLRSEAQYFHEILASPGKAFPPHHTRFKHKDGTYRWIEYSATNLIEDPEIGAIVYNFRDITAWKRAEEQKRFLEEAGQILSSSIDYETTLRNIATLIIPYLADYCRIVVVDESRQIKELAVHHVNPEEVPLVRELYNAYQDNATHTVGVGTLLETGTVEYMPRMTPERVVNASPRVLALIRKLHLQSYMGVPMKIGSKVVGAITFSSTRADRIYTETDIALAEELSRRAALAIENAQLYSDAQKAIALRDEFMGIVSHELKTPVTSVKAFTQVLQRRFARAGDEQSTELLGKMDVQINRLTSLIGDLLDVTKIQGGRLQFNEDLFYFDHLVSEMVEEIQRTAISHSIEVIGETKSSIYGDKDRIGQVLTNILTNAIKYSPDSDRIIVRMGVDGKSLILSVQDFGIGIPKERQQQIFERFYRVDGNGTVPGIGLGLYISSEIIRRQGGKIWVESDQGSGSIFSFSLPIPEAGYIHE
jgi:PAS domain S-box-containing protein